MAWTSPSLSRSLTTGPPGPRFALLGAPLFPSRAYPGGGALLTFSGSSCSGDSASGRRAYLQAQPSQSVAASDALLLGLRAAPVEGLPDLRALLRSGRSACLDGADRRDRAWDE